MFHTSNVIISDCSRFVFIRSILDEMLRNVPLNSEIITANQSLPVSSPHPVTAEIHKVLEEVDKLKKGGKQKEKAGPSKPA